MRHSSEIHQLYVNRSLELIQASFTLTQLVKYESFFTSGKQNKIDCFNVDGYCDHCKTVFEAMGLYYYFCSCQEAQSWLKNQNFNRGAKSRETDDMKREDTKKKGYKVEEMVCGGKLSKPMQRSKITSKPSFPTLHLFLKTPFYQKEKWVSFWLCSVPFCCSWLTKIKICQLSSFFQKHRI